MTARKPSAELDTLQRWMLSVVTHPGGVLEGIASADSQQQIGVATDELERIIKRSRNLTSVERLEVYANAYYARLFECLREEFPTLVYVLGEETFNGFAFQYLQAYPPRSYTLAMLGAHFPQFLCQTRPAGETEALDSVDWPDFLIDLATLERTYSEVFDGHGIEGQAGLRPEDLLAISAEQWPEARLIPVACLRLLALRFPVHEFASDVKHGNKPSFPSPSPTFLVITRRNYVVRPRAVSRTEYQVLNGLCEGHTVGEVVSLASQMRQSDTEQLAVELHDCFRRWSADGLFQAIELGGSGSPE